MTWRRNFEEKTCGMKHIINEGLCFSVIVKGKKNCVDEWTFFSGV